MSHKQHLSKNSIRSDDVGVEDLEMEDMAVRVQSESDSDPEEEEKQLFEAMERDIHPFSQFSYFDIFPWFNLAV